VVDRIASAPMCSSALSMLIRVRFACLGMKIREIRNKD
jgi:hypothetical protein